MARTGRRPGDSGTREAILAAARAEFAARGYDATSIRGVARAAGVDPALVHHFHGGKQQLFIAAMELPIQPAEVVAHVLAGGRDEIGERLVRQMLALWDGPGRERMQSVLRSALSSDAAAAMLREFLAREMLGGIAAGLEVADAELRTSLVASQIVGLALARYVVALEPLASADADRVVAAVAPTVQRYLTGPLDE